MHEWPVLIFTLSIQASIGLSALLIALYLTNRLVNINGLVTLDILFKPLVLAVVLAALGLMASFGHLGYPLNAPNAIRHISTSWLSREIVLSSFYIGLLGLTVLALYFNKYTQYIRPILILGAIVGLINIYCMAHIYRATSIVTWKSINTNILFFGTCLNIGGILILCWFQSSLASNKRLYNFAKVLTTIMVLYSFFQLLFLPAYITYIQSHPYNEMVTFPIDSVSVYLDNIQLQYYRFIALGLGLAITVWSVFKCQTQYLYVACGFLIFSEIIGRYALYNIYA